MKDLKISVAEIKGKCPVYKNSDIIYLDKGYSVNLKKTDSICLHSLASIMPYHLALSSGIKPFDLGLAKKSGDQKKAYVQCLDPCNYTGGGTVTFEIEVLE